MQRATVAPPPLLAIYDDDPATESVAATGPWRIACAPQRCWKICAGWTQNTTTTIANAHGSVRDPDQAAARAACACAARACSGLVRVPSEAMPVRRSMPAISQRRRACECCMSPLAALHGRLRDACRCMRRCSDADHHCPLPAAGSSVCWALVRCCGVCQGQAD